MTKASNSICKKSTMAKRIGIIVIIVDWILFLGFGALASHFMLSVIDHFQAKTTSFSQSLEPITKLPTILMCIEGSRIFNYSNLITLSYSNQGRYYEKIENIKENEIYHFKYGNESFQVVQAQDKCLKLESNLTSPYQHGTRAIEFKFKWMMKSVHFYFTSEENSIGSLFQQWWDGQVLDIVVDKGREAIITLQPFESRYLSFNNRCSNMTHTDKWLSTIPELNFSSCPKKCSPSTSLSHILPLCGWDIEWNTLACSRRILQRSLFDFTASKGFKTPCQILEYHGYKIFEQDNYEDENALELRYTFAPPFKSKVQQEYLIYDMAGMIGSVGGTLGMCIGFSFSGVTTNLLEYIQARLTNNI